MSMLTLGDIGRASAWGQEWEGPVYPVSGTQCHGWRFAPRGLTTAARRAGHRVRRGWRVAWQSGCGKPWSLVQVSPDGYWGALA